MKSFIPTVLFCLIIGNLFSQRPGPDEIKTNKGMLRIQPVYHAAMVLSWNNKTIYVDPYGGAKAFEGLDAPDLILITDIHQDHMDTVTLNAIATKKSAFIVPQAVADKLPAKWKNKLIILSNGNTIVEQGISVTAIPMYNLPEEPESRHTKGRGNGYVLDLGGKKVYISGDTEDIPEMRSLKNIHIAFVCMNLPYTMDVMQAADAVLEFKPAVVYPYHYRGKEGMSDTEIFKRRVGSGGDAIEVRIRNWYPG